jgi:hypothetical protein
MGIETIAVLLVLFLATRVVNKYSIECWRMPDKDPILGVGLGLQT